MAIALHPRSRDLGLISGRDGGVVYLGKELNSYSAPCQLRVQISIGKLTRKYEEIVGRGKGGGCTLRAMK